MRLLVVPEADSYTLNFPKHAERAELEGGLGRYRRDILNGSVRISPTWILDPTEYNYFMAFYREETVYGSEPFEMYLIVNSTTQVECTCNIIPGTVKLASQRGLAYTVSCELEVVPPYNPTQSTDDDATIAAFNSANGYTP